MLGATVAAPTSVSLSSRIAERLKRLDGVIGGSGVLQGLHAGLRLTVADLLSLMMAVSDNTATNLLVGLVGTANVDRRLEGYGLVDTKLFRPTFRDGKPDVHPELEREFGLGMATPRELGRLMELIAEGKVVSRAASDEMLALLPGAAVPHHDPAGSAGGR